MEIRLGDFKINENLRQVFDIIRNTHVIKNIK